MTTRPETVDEYLATLPEDVRAKLQDVRATIHRTLPDAEERISYGMPTFCVGGRSVVHLAGWRHHLSLYPVPAVPDDLEPRVAPLRSGRGTLKLTLREPVPHDLIEILVRLLADQRDPS